MFICPTYGTIGFDLREVELRDTDNRWKCYAINYWLHFLLSNLSMVDGIHETSRLQLIQSEGVRGKPILRKLLRESLDLLVTACKQHLFLKFCLWDTQKVWDIDSCVLVYWLSIGTLTVCQKRLISCVLVVPIRSSRSNGTIAAKMRVKRTWASSFLSKSCFFHLFPVYHQ